MHIISVTSSFRYKLLLPLVILGFLVLANMIFFCIRAIVLNVCGNFTWPLSLIRSWLPFTMIQMSQFTESNIKGIVQQENSEMQAYLDIISPIYCQGQECEMVWGAEIHYENSIISVDF